MKTIETKHTPGPWKLRDESITGPNGVASVQYEIDSVGSFYFGDCHITRDATVLAQMEANARLIAAAPEMLAACQRALPWLGRMIADGAHLGCVAPNDCVGAMQQMEAAIQKAKGNI